MTRKCIINVSTGELYKKGLARLEESVRKFHDDIDIMKWVDGFPPNSPTHEEVPYAFKVYAFFAARDAGYDQVLWMDAPLIAVKPITPVFDHMTENGCYLQDNPGWNSGQWCTDAALDTLGVSREELFKVPQIMACILGLDFGCETSNKFLDEWHRLSQDGITFHGPWTNANGEASPDSRVLGHRHDQTAASVVSIRLGMPWVSGPDSKLVYKNADIQNVDDHVVIVSCGI